MEHGNFKNMKKYVPALVITGSFLGLILLRAKELWDKLVWRVKWAELRILTEKDITLAVVFEVYNPTIVTFNIGNLRGNILMNGEKVGTINYPINRPFYKKSVNQITILVKLSYADISNSMYDQIMRGSLTNWVLAIDGTLDVSDKAVPFNQEFTIADFQ